MWKSCSKCGKIHSTKYKCTVGKKYFGGDERKLRNKSVWARKSQEIRAKADYLCEVCRDQGIYTYNNLEVHHIVKIKDDPDMYLDDLNLICLCQNHHKKAEKGMMNDYLRKLAEKRENGFIQ